MELIGMLIDILTVICDACCGGDAASKKAKSVERTLTRNGRK